MKLSQEQLEWIVREVVRRLSEASPSSGANAQAGTLVLSERLVTLETLRGRLGGIRSLQVPAKAIVTPAVVDLLKERQVQLQRQTCNK